MSVDERPTLLAIQHVPWEGPHRILDACGSLHVHTVKPLAGQPLPSHDEVAGAVVMGGPMNVDEVERFPGLAAEREWLAEALRRELPLLGICLGAQLLARALGAEVRPGEGPPEIGFAAVEVSDPGDPLLGGLAPSTDVLHWHGDVFDLPDGAQPLASSARTEHQAFRAGNAWGVLFHPEADLALVEAWLAVPEMIDEACAALGDDGEAALAEQARATEAALVERTAPGFEAFAQLVAANG
jgi:GMP synthase (glutamine-hydrolysing)